MAMAFGPVAQAQIANPMLVNGVKSGHLNKSEFRHLNSERNRLAALKNELRNSKMPADAQQRILAAEEHKYQVLVQKYHKEDVFIKSQPDGETDKLYNGIKSGEITRGEALSYMAEERRNSAKPAGVTGTARREEAHRAHLTWISKNDQRESAKTHHQTAPSPSHQYPHHHSNPLPPAPKGAGAKAGGGIPRQMRAAMGIPLPGSTFNGKG